MAKSPNPTRAPEVCDLEKMVGHAQCLLSSPKSDVDSRPSQVAQPLAEESETTRLPLDARSERTQASEEVANLKSKLDEIISSDHPVSRPLLWRLLSKRVADIRKKKDLFRLLGQLFDEKS